MVSMFLDDGFGCNNSFDNTLQMSIEIKQDLLFSGFIPNAEKSVWSPVQILPFLGTLLNSYDGQLSIPDTRLSKVKSTISNILADLKVHRRVGVRKLASLVGQIISMSVVIGHVSQIMTRCLSIDIVRAFSWDSYIGLSQESLYQMEFWQSTIDSINSKNIFESYRCTKVVYSDASSTGFAGYIVTAADDISHGSWSAEESLKSSTWRELVAVLRVIKSLVHLLVNHRVKWFTDNQGVASIVCKGSMKPELQNIAMQIYRVCFVNSITLDAEWVPRSENEKADYLSKIVDLDDWGLSFKLVRILQERFGVFEVDWFASESNAKVNKFYSRFWNSSCYDIDAFAANWGQCFGLFVPPPCIIHKVLNKMAVDKASGVLVVPLWTSAPYWPILCPNGRYISAVSDWMDLPTKKEYYVKCSNGKGMFGNIDLNFRMVALSLKF